MFTLHDLGYFDELENFRVSNNLLNFEVGRIISEHKERYTVKTTDGEFEGEIIGNLRFTAKNRNDFPAVGDWVSILKYDSCKVIIYNVLPRINVIERQAVGKFGEKQIIASNIDFAFIVQAVGRDFNVNRIERYLTICNAAGVAPIVVINKIDLISAADLQIISSKISERIKNIPIIFISNETKSGFENLVNFIEKGKTYCLLGSSGVGKSTILNNLVGKSVMQTNAISETINRGKHVTSHRHLFVLDSGGLLIDNPGMREVGLTNVESGLEITFTQISELAINCKYADCKHINESGCAVLKALENGEIDEGSYENYLKLEREKQHFEMDNAEKRKKDKSFGKLMKQYKKDVKKDF